MSTLGPIGDYVIYWSDVQSSLGRPIVSELIEYTAVLRLYIPHLVLDAGSERVQQGVDLVAVLVPARYQP